MIFRVRLVKYGHFLFSEIGGKMEKLTINSGFRVSPTQMAKLEHVAASLQVSRNAAIGHLIEAAAVRLAVPIEQKNNRQDASNLTGPGILAVEA